MGAFKVLGTLVLALNVLTSPVRAENEWEGDRTVDPQIYELLATHTHEEWKTKTVRVTFQLESFEKASGFRAIANLEAEEIGYSQISDQWKVNVRGSLEQIDCLIQLPGILKVSLMHDDLPDDFVPRLKPQRMKEMAVDYLANEMDAVLVGSLRNALELFPGFPGIVLEGDVQLSSTAQTRQSADCAQALVASSSPTTEKAFFYFSFDDGDHWSVDVALDSEF